MAISSIFSRLAGRLIVSCQASQGDAFYDPGSMARFAAAAVQGGAGGIRANGPADIRAIRQAVNVPIIGIWKRTHADGRIIITPSFEDAYNLAQAGADLIALDCTARGQRNGAIERLRRIRRELGVPVLADTATLEEAMQAAEAGADAVLPTLRGYTAETAHITHFQPEFLAELVRSVSVPVIAEGRIDIPEHAAQALASGAFAVVVGTSITRPHVVTRRFVTAMEEAARPPVDNLYAAIDLGGTNTKSGLVSQTGELVGKSVSPTPSGGRPALLQHLKSVARGLLAEAKKVGREVRAIGIATAGWVDAETGTVVYATENLPGWTGTPIAREVGEATGLPVFVENDANALAIGEGRFGAARTLRDYVCITLGTGVGGGCVAKGLLNRGANFMANAFGHICISPQGRPCTCGRQGCLEAYANAAALLGYAGGGYACCEEVISAANQGEAQALEAVRTLARHLAAGCHTLIQLLDPEALILSGGLAENNPVLPAAIAAELAGSMNLWAQRSVSVRTSELGYYGGVLGAAAVAIDGIEAR